MPSKKEAQYDLVSDDGYDSKAFYSEEDFKIGIDFKAKMIGKMDVPRPNNRGEIVSAMRRVRYEFKAKSVKKRRVIISIAVDGISIYLRKRKAKVQFWKETHMTLYQHPIHRVFYVSHDSQDLNIFSYIARDTNTNAFMCLVFKSYRKSQAIGIVGTIGQAFEVCHRLNIDREKLNCCQRSEDSTGCDTDAYRYNSIESDNSYLPTSESQNGSHVGILKKIDEVSLNGKEEISTPHLGKVNGGAILKSSCSNTPASIKKPNLNFKLPVEEEKNNLAMAQIELLKEQLMIETTSRIEAQARANQLLEQNKQLYTYLQALVNRVNELEETIGKFSENQKMFASESLPENPLCTDKRVVDNSKSSSMFCPFILSTIAKDTAFNPNLNSEDFTSITTRHSMGVCQKEVKSHESNLKDKFKNSNGSPESSEINIRPPPMFDQALTNSESTNHNAPVNSPPNQVENYLYQTKKNSQFLPEAASGKPAESPDSGHKDMSSDSLCQMMFWSANPGFQTSFSSNQPINLLKSYTAMSWPSPSNNQPYSIDFINCRFPDENKAPPNSGVTHKPNTQGSKLFSESPEPLPDPTLKIPKLEPPPDKFSTTCPFNNDKRRLRSMTQDRGGGGASIPQSCLVISPSFLSSERSEDEASCSSTRTSSGVVKCDVNANQDYSAASLLNSTC